jgi:hypothetical protein
MGCDFEGLVTGCISVADEEAYPKVNKCAIPAGKYLYKKIPALGGRLSSCLFGRLLYRGLFFAFS